MNKNGWGLRVELAFILLFLFCLLIATIGIHTLGLMRDKSGAYIDLSPTGSGYDYSVLETKLTNAASKYYYDYYPYGLGEEVKITADTLVYNNYMSRMYDEKGRTCDGYARILTNGNIVSYIKCPKYVTPGYKG